jgi:hypothetical protein
MPGVARRAPTSVLAPATLRKNSIFYDYICVRTPLQLSHRGVLGVLGLGVASGVLPSQTPYVLSIERDENTKVNFTSKHNSCLLPARRDDETPLVGKAVT